ncbi:hypothetical protein AK830_g4471 [Neonectria ditissima]|uniref:Uncharacterized protein n=1 Tax=Neonectria ditissima TaxID=78410 RepID=A0A0P7B8C7_9HYPO|nr:hypothetical protein AK830_g4471 [Neonectria ditissima]
MESFAEHFLQVPALRDDIANPDLDPVKMVLNDGGPDIMRSDFGDMKKGQEVPRQELILSKRTKKEFDDAIHKALNTKDVLMFCATSDQGRSADLTYPHGSNRTIFEIEAAKTTGSIIDTVGDALELDFIFHGHQDVMGVAMIHSIEICTASLVALVIECVRLGVVYTSETEQQGPTLAIKKDDLAKIRDRNNMKNALLSIRTSQNTDNKYIEVRDKFDAAAEKLRQNEGSRIDQLEKIATLARHSLGKRLDYEDSQFTSAKNSTLFSPVMHPLNMAPSPHLPSSRPTPQDTLLRLVGCGTGPGDTCSTEDGVFASLELGYSLPSCTGLDLLDGSPGDAWESDGSAELLAVPGGLAMSSEGTFTRSPNGDAAPEVPDDVCSMGGIFDPILLMQHIS